jgi:two-component system LytT family response regulator
MGFNDIINNMGKGDVLMKLLIVESEPDALEELKGLVHNYDKSLEIETCINPAQAIQSCRDNTFQVVLLDVLMSEMSGFELAGYLSALSPGISIIFISEYNNFASEAFEVNALDYILKPVGQKRLNKALDKARKKATECVTRNISKSRHVTIQAFGKMVVSCDGSVVKWKRRKSAEVFAYLLHQQGLPVHKEKLCEIMWCEFNPQKSLTYPQTRYMLLLNRWFSCLNPEAFPTSLKGS